jgi:hypothetical protein
LFSMRLIVRSWHAPLASVSFKSELTLDFLVI